MTWLIRITLLLLLIVIGAYTVMFALNNSTVVSINFLLFKLENLRLELALILSFITGGLLGLLSLFPLLWRERKLYRQKLKQFKQDNG